MKKVLIISYHFFTKERIGTRRIQGLANYLPDFGWEPTILTADSGHFSGRPVQVIEARDPGSDTPLTKILDIKPGTTESSSLKRSWSHLMQAVENELFYYPDPRKNWVPDAVEAGKELLRTGDFDAILSSSYPPSSHLVANQLQQASGIPWIADFRDLWTRNHYFYHTIVRRIAEHRLELNTISPAAALTTVSGPLAVRLAQLHTGKPVHAVPGGFDPDEANPGSPLTEKFSIIYTGSLYNKRRDPEPLFRVLRNLIDENQLDPENISVDFYGPLEYWLTGLISFYDLNDVVHVHGPVSREVSVRKQWESHILLLLLWNNPQERGTCTGKLFDYLAAKRPILCLGMIEGVVRDLIDDCQVGICLAGQGALRQQILTYYDEYKRDGSVAYHGLPEKVNCFTQIEMARKFSAVLDSVVLGTNNRRAE